MPAERLSIRVAEDRSTAFVSVVAGLGSIPDLRAALATAGVVTGVDEALVSELAVRVNDPTFEQPEQQIAAGRAPTSGRPGHVELAFEAALSPGALSDDGHMNFLERGLLKTVASGDLVATLVAPEAGRPGFTVDGQVAPPPPPTAATLRLGPGVEADANGAVRATRAGAVLYKAGESLDVVSSHVHRGAVDLHSGHLDMQGSLVIEGDVERLLQARASGDLELRGSLSGGSLRAGGSLRVSGNVRGGDGGQVIAERDVELSSCESAQVTAGAVLRVREAVASQLHGRDVVVSGRLRGGAAVAERRVSVREAGNAAGIGTLLQAGEAVELPKLDDVQRAVLMQKLRRMAERGGVREAFGSRGEGRAKGGKLERVVAAQSVEQLRELAAAAARRVELERGAVIEVSLAHPGVELRIGSARLSIEQTARGLRYALDLETGRLVATRSLA